MTRGRDNATNLSLGHEHETRAINDAEYDAAIRRAWAPRRAYSFIPLTRRQRLWRRLMEFLGRN